MKMFHVKHERREKKMSSSINNETHEKEDSTMEMPKVTVTDAVNILRTMAENLVSTIVRTPYEEKKIRELAEDYMKIAKAVEDMEAAHLTECAQHEDELRKQKNKRITIELPAGYDDALSITAYGREMSVKNELPNIMVRVTEVRVADLTGHDGDVLVIHPDEDCEWRKPETGWIPVSERMPEPNVTVRVKGEDFEEEAFWGRFTHQWIDSISGVGVDNVTHWMPLPEPPEEV